jgi:hypothetical protein
MYKGDVQEKYERARKTAQQKLDQERENEALATGSVSDENLRLQGVSRISKTSLIRSTRISTGGGQMYLVSRARIEHHRILITTMSSLCKNHAYG